MTTDQTNNGKRAPHDECLQNLRLHFGHLDGRAVLEPLLRDVFKGRIAAWSSFGAESAVLLHMISSVDPGTPILFVDTGKLFPETLAYRNRLIANLGLTDVRTLSPEKAEQERLDRDGTLWQRDPDTCCAMRKVSPLAVNLTPFAALITGRKRYQAATRSSLQVIEQVDGRIKINPLAGWSEDRVRTYMSEHDLPDHPLVWSGYLSIGCAPCTMSVKSGEHARTGRWRGREKTECGIHFAGGRPVGQNA